MSSVRVLRGLVVAGTVALAALALLRLAFRLPVAELWQFDEWYTAERVHGILTRHDWLTLYENGMPVFKKPPLQYWLSAIFAKEGVQGLLALRLPSFIAAIGVVALVAGLAVRLSGRTLAAPVAVALLLCSPQFWVSATSAMLDMGAAFFLLAAVMACFAAWQAPRWWWGVAMLLGLGALQKAPVAVVAVPVVALVMYMGGVRPARAGWHLWALGLALAGLAFWPLVQGVLHGEGSVEVTYLREQVMRIAPGHRDWARHLRWTDWVAADGVVLWAGLVAGALAAPFVLRGAGRQGGERRAEAAAVAVWVVLFFIAMTAADGELFDRYLMQVLPFAAAGAGAVLVSLPPATGLVGAAVLVIAAGGPVKPAREAGLENEGVAPYRAILANFRASLRPDETPVVCGWEKSDLEIFPGALWLLGSADAPFRRVWSAEDVVRAVEAGNLAPPVRGLCKVTEYATLSALLPLRAEGADAGFVHWAYP